METGQTVWIIVYVIIGLAVVAAFVKILSKNATPQIKKTPAHYVSISAEDNLDAFATVYDLDWKPERELISGIPPDVEKIINSIESISPLITDLSARLNDPDINPKDISRLIITDQGLTSFILKRVNSPYYGLVQKVDNIFNAIVILGYNEIYRIVMEERAAKIGIKPSREEWIHANLTSTIAAYLASTSRIGVPGGTMVTLGMLHDIARTIMLQSLPQPENGFSRDPRERLRQETELYGIDHATLGGILARRWQMPERLSNAIGRHHWPMFWPLREVAQASPDVIKELAILSISDVAAKNFSQDITGTYIGDDYYRFIKKPPKIESILMPEITRDLKRIRHIGETKHGESGDPQAGSDRE
ncbi:MAG: HDOD domain-containing protein [Desulfomonilia bacterium]|jgi:HD-like signal output (HDOD) protein|uniref:HDOD domain protein (Modular protein) n=1 Tax=anaerobic digester metagenome TaxID=1263854 RepID=A0A485LTK6_9ZZZZ|nr:HDOD domain-containing protein [Pseudomonadota bacterium]HPD21798.1 HDOD domain-containing protein [Deltaproteobacteria bacterium]HRS56607.1 HDOD domain-containing protein [Desulfomonilia bacterium]HRV36376.1 HDOD domain-containing protein [Desulfomonilia bacterium]